MSGVAQVVEPAAAWTTVMAPAVVALGFALAAIVGWGRSEVRASVRSFCVQRAAWIVGIALIATAVRLGWLPVFERHIYDGHEAEYFALFTHERVPSRGGTVLYPLMQWAYWFLGVVCTGTFWPVVIAVLFGLGSVAALGVAAGTAFGLSVGIATALGLALMGNHAFWSTSAYNVIHPVFFCSVSVAAAYRWRDAVRTAGTAPLWLWALLWSSALLAVCLRLECALVIVPLVAVLIPNFASVSKREWGLIGLGAVVGLLAIWPLLFPGGLPGEGERWMSFQLNWRLLIYGAPWSHPVWLCAAGVGVALARSEALPWALWAVVGHLSMASFDDFGFRHMLLPSSALLVLGCVGVERLWARGGWRRVVAGALAASGIGLMLGNTADIADRFYQAEEAWEEKMLARYSEAALREMTPEARPECALISEADVIAEQPPLSHFNLLDDREAESLRARTGCLHWCPDVQDGRWSSRAVFDRAIRIESLYDLEPIGMVREPLSGYACFLYEVGSRRPRMRVSRTAD